MQIVVVMATKQLLATFLLLALVGSATSQSATVLGVSEYVGIAFGAVGLLCIVLSLVALCCGLCCCCAMMKKRKRGRGTLLYSADGRPVTYVKNEHSANPAYGSSQYDGIKMYNNTQTFQTFVPSYVERHPSDARVGFSRTTYVGKPSQVSQVIQEGPVETGHISPSTSFSDKPIYTATVGPNRNSVSSFSNPTFSRSSIVRTSLVVDPTASDNVNDVVSTTATVITTTTEETVEESSEHITKTEFRKSSIKK